MRRRRPAPERPALLGPAGRLWLLLPFVLAGLAVLSANAWLVSQRLDDARSAQSDNTTWLVAQLEVEALKLAGTVDRLRDQPGDESGLPALRKAFDVYLSRIQVIDGYMRQPGRLYELHDNPDWQEVLRARDELTQLIDVPDPALLARIDRIAARLETLRTPLRGFIVEALARLVAASTQGREALAALIGRSALIAIILIAVLLATSFFMLRLSMQLQRRSHAEERARSNLEKTLAASLDGVVVARQDGRILQVNPAAEQIFGLAREALLGRGIFDLLSPVSPADMDQVRALRARFGAAAAEEAPAGRIVFRARRQDGGEVSLELSLAADRDGDGGLILIAFFRDISDRVRAEQELRSAHDAAVRAATAKSRFLAVMSHEMRTPLNAVIAVLDLLRTTTRPSQRQGRFLGIAEASAQTALDQINDVLEVARLEGRNQPEEAVPLNLTRLVREIAEQTAPLIHKNRNRLHLDLPQEGEAQLLGPRRLLVQVLVNLLGNAAKFTNGGEIRVTARIEAPEPGLRLLSVEVRDTGCGIPPDKLERIFDLFETLDDGYDRAAPGTGLGLVIVRKAVQSMGGEVAVTSMPGLGSAFRFTARMRPIDVPAEAPPAPDSAAPAPPGLHVLVVEDNPVNRIVLREMLEHLGQTVTEAEDGPAGVAAAQRIAFDLVLMDVSMPGMDGPTAAAAIRAGGASARSRIVALTAHALPEDLRRIRASGIPDILIKPATIARLAELLSGSAPGGGAGRQRARIDPQVIGDLRRLLSPELRRSNLARLLDEGAAVMAALEDGAASTSQARQPLVAQLHRFRGACALFGATRMADLLLQAETAPDALPLPGGLRQAIGAEWAALIVDLPQQLEFDDNAVSSP